MNQLTFQTDTGLSSRLCRMAGVAAWVLLVYSLVTIALLLIVGGPPESALESFEILQANRLVGLLRLDLLTFLVMPFYYLLFMGLYLALRQASPAGSLLALVLVFVGVTLFLTTPSALSLAYLSDRHAAASTDMERSLYLAAGEGLIASDMWHSTAALISGLFVQGAGVLISLAMLRSQLFSRVTAYLGIVIFGLDLLHILAGLFSPLVSFVLMATAGPLYLLWFPLVARRLYRLGRVEPGLPSEALDY